MEKRGFLMMLLSFSVIQHWNHFTSKLPIMCDNKYLYSLSHLVFFLIYFIYFFNYYYFFFTLQYCTGFGIHQHASATGVHVFPILSHLVLTNVFVVESIASDTTAKILLLQRHHISRGGEEGNNYTIL